MNVEKKTMSWLQKIIYTICFIGLIWAFIFLGTRNYKVKELTDNELFSKEFKTIQENNLFQVFNSTEALTFLENGTGLLFLGFPENKWSSSVAEILNQISLEQNYSISYFNFLEERRSRHDNYIGMIRELDDYLKSDDEGNLNLFAPTIIGVVKGKVIYLDDQLTFVNNLLDPKDYWTTETKEEFMNRLRHIIQELKAVRE